jgi:hypothetical protein
MMGEMGDDGAVLARSGESGRRRQKAAEGKEV